MIDLDAKIRSLVERNIPRKDIAASSEGWPLIEPPRESSVSLHYCPPMIRGLATTHRLGRVMANLGTKAAREPSRTAFGTNCRSAPVPLIF